MAARTFKRTVHPDWDAALFEGVNAAHERARLHLACIRFNLDGFQREVSVADLEAFLAELGVTAPERIVDYSYSEWGPTDEQVASWQALKGLWSYVRERREALAREIAARLRRSRNLKPPIAIVETPIEPMAPCTSIAA